MMDDVTKLLSGCQIYKPRELNNTPVSGPYGPLTRRYAPTAASPCRDHSEGAHHRLSRLIAD